MNQRQKSGAWLGDVRYKIKVKLLQKHSKQELFYLGFKTARQDSSLTLIQDFRNWEFWKKSQKLKINSKLDLNLDLKIIYCPFNDA